MSGDSSQAPIIVIGAGIIGVCVAAYLQRDGFDVTLIDHGEPGSGASSGNGGILSGSSIIPVGMPGVAAKVPGWLLESEGPFTLRWSYLPNIAPWLMRLLLGATRAKVEVQASALRALLKASLENYAPLVRDASATHLLHQHGQLYLYANEQSWRNDAGNTDIRRRNGVAIEDVIGPALRALEPDLGESFTHARLVRANGHVSDPHALVQALATHAAARGAKLFQERVTGFEHNGAQVTAVVTERRRHAASRVVVACGAWSKPLAEELGAPSTHGMVVVRMQQRSDAYVAGMRPGDVIVSFDGTKVEDDYHIMRLLADAKIGSTVTLGLLRDGKALAVKVPIVKSMGQVRRR